MIENFIAANRISEKFFFDNIIAFSAILRNQDWPIFHAQNMAIQISLSINIKEHVIIYSEMVD